MADRVPLTLEMNNDTLFKDKFFEGQEEDYGYFYRCRSSAGYSVS